MKIQSDLRYRCLDLDVFHDGAYAITPLRKEDMMPIMTWRNAQQAVLRGKTTLTEEQQQGYWLRVIEPSFAQEEPAQLLFTFFFQHEPIGYGGLVHLSWQDRRAEVSFLVAPERAENLPIYARDFAAWLGMLKLIAFKQLRLQRLSTETYDIRKHHIQVLEASGFAFEGRMRRHLIIDGQPVDSLIHGCLNAEFPLTP